MEFIYLDFSIRSHGQLANMRLLFLVHLTQYHRGILL